MELWTVVHVDNGVKTVASGLTLQEAYASWRSLDGNVDLLTDEQFKLESEGK